MNRNNGYSTGNLLDCAYFKKDQRLIAIDLSKQTKLKDPQQVNFTGRLERQDNKNNNNNNNEATMFFITEKSEKTTFELCEHDINNGNTKDCKFVKQF